MSTIFFALDTKVLASKNPSKADSLFAKGEYVAAYTAYALLHAKEELHTAHVLRMAYIQEGLQDYPKALYHLMEYYYRTQNEHVWEQIHNLSTTHGLLGYGLTEMEQLFLWLFTHNMWWIIGMSSLWAGCVIACLRRGWGRRVALLCMSGCILSFLLASRPWLPKGAVILSKTAYLRKTESGAAPLLEAKRLVPGSLVRIESTGKPWTLINYEGKTGYVRTYFLGFLP